MVRYIPLALVLPFVGIIGADAVMAWMAARSDPGLVARAKESDLILAVGTRLGEATSQGYTLFPAGRSSPIVHVHPDPAELGGPDGTPRAPAPAGSDSDWSSTAPRRP